MARSTSNRPESKRNPEPTPAQVAAYLRRHPDFLIRHPEVLDGLKPGDQVVISGTGELKEVPEFHIGG